jgi:DNA-binding IclR family transcriptional regulator
MSQEPPGLEVAVPETLRKNAPMSAKGGIMRKMNKPAGESIEVENSEKLDIHSSPTSFVTRIAKILDCLGDGTNTVTDIARNCDLSTSTTHRLLNALKEPLLTVYDPCSHRYYLGPLIAKLTSRTKATHQHLVICALNEMKRLSGVTGETVSLDMIIGIQFVHLFEIYSKHPLKVLGETNEIQPIIPLGAAQKVLLSQLSEKDLRFALRTAENWITDEQYLTDIEVIKPQLAQIKQLGYATSCGEAILGAMAISAPVRNYCSPLALTLLGPENRMIGRVPELIKELMDATDAVSRDILEFF